MNRHQARIAMLIEDIAFQQRETYLFLGWSWRGRARSEWYQRAKARFWAAFRLYRTLSVVVGPRRRKP